MFKYLLLFVVSVYCVAITLNVNLYNPEISLILLAISLVYLVLKHRG